MVFVMPGTITPEKTSADLFRNYIPGTLIASSAVSAWDAVLFEIYARRRVEDCILVPAVAEPLIIWILSGTAHVEERLPGGTWTGRTVQSGEFFLATSAIPYEVRWQVSGPDPLITSHIYLSLEVYSHAMQDVTGGGTNLPVLQGVFGGRDDVLTFLLDLLRQELIERASPSALLVRSVAHTIAVHLVRTYRDAENPWHAFRGELPTFTLRKIMATLEARLDHEFQLSDLAKIAGMSKSHFSRTFKKTTGLSPSQHFIRMRMAKARQLLRETEMSMIEIALEVGYSSPSHFAQVFRREVGVPPTDYRWTRSD